MASSLNIELKACLQKHVSSILDGILKMGGAVPYEVFDCQNDVVPPPFGAIELTHEFLVCLDFSGVQKSVTTTKSKLASLLHKEISEIAHDRISWLYWQDGDRLIKQTAHINPVAISPNIGASCPQEEQAVKWLQTETCLPAWLDSFIFDVLNARHEPDYQKFEHNLELSEDDLRIYLGTYFPRSYAEAFCIVDDLCGNQMFLRSLTSKKTLNVLDIGCGCGGDLIGLLTAIQKHCHKTETVNVIALDGHEGALSILSQIADRFAHKTKKQVNIRPITTKITRISDLSDFSGVTFDFILTFKMISELISEGGGTCDHSYHDFAEKCAPLLATDGLLIMLDVTTKAPHANFYPRLMNRQINLFTQQHPDFMTLLPLSCSAHSGNCANSCFHQKTFKVSHKRGKNAPTRVAYRVIGRKCFVEMITRAIAPNRFVVYKKDNTSATEAHICPFTQAGNKLDDAFRLSGRTVAPGAFLVAKTIGS